MMGEDTGLKSCSTAVFLLALSGFMSQVRRLFLLQNGCSKHITDNAISTSDQQKQEHEAMTLIEKKTVINLLEGYAVAVKHYLRGEDGIHYEDLYPLVPFLYSCHYPFPAIVPPADLRKRKLLHVKTHSNHPRSEVASPQSTIRSPASPNLSASNQVPPANILDAKSSPAKGTAKTTSSTIDSDRWSDDIESQPLLPAELPPRYCWRWAFPFPLLYRTWKAIKKAAHKDADQRPCRSKHNVPLEISLYLVRMSHRAWKI